MYQKIIIIRFIISVSLLSPTIKPFPLRELLNYHEKNVQNAQFLSFILFSYFICFACIIMHVCVKCPKLLMKLIIIVWFLGGIKQIINILINDDLKKKKTNENRRKLKDKDNDKRTI